MHLCIKAEVVTLKTRDNTKDISILKSQNINPVFNVEHTCF